LLNVTANSNIYMIGVRETNLLAPFCSLPPADAGGPPLAGKSLGFLVWHLIKFAQIRGGGEVDPGFRAPGKRIAGLWLFS
jgi:hypothetical protein